MTETEFYDLCSAFLDQSRAATENETRTYMLISVIETEDRLVAGFRIIDPGLPDNFSGLPLHYDLAKQTVLYLSKHLDTLLDKATDTTLALKQLLEVVDPDTLEEALKKAETAEEFSALLTKQIRLN